jgi:hypothetical protein
MQISKKTAAASVLLLVALAVGATLLLFDRLPARETFPAGCSSAERTLPGCHPTATRLTTNTVAVIAVVISPLATLLVALVAVNSGRSRQTEELEAEKRRQRKQLKADFARQKAQLRHERELKDLDALRALLDRALAVVDDRREENLRTIAGGKVDDTRRRELQRETLTVSSLLFVRLRDGDPMLNAWMALTRALAAQDDVTERLTSVADQSERRAAFEAESPSGAMSRTFVNFTVAALRHAGYRFAPVADGSSI